MGKTTNESGLLETMEKNQNEIPNVEGTGYGTLEGKGTSVTTHLYLSNFFFITASFHDILKETAVITYGKTKKIYYQAQ